MSTNSSSNGVSIIGLIGLLFLALKLTGVIDWSWWYVTLPFWGGLALFLVALVVYLLIISIKELIKIRWTNRKATLKKLLDLNSKHSNN